MIETTAIATAYAVLGLMTAGFVLGPSKGNPGVVKVFLYTVLWPFGAVIMLAAFSFGVGAYFGKKLT